MLQFVRPPASVRLFGLALAVVFANAGCGPAASSTPDSGRPGAGTGGTTVVADANPADGALADVALDAIIDVAAPVDSPATDLATDLAPADLASTDVASTDVAAVDAGGPDAPGDAGSDAAASDASRDGATEIPPAGGDAAADRGGDATPTPEAGTGDAGAPGSIVTTLDIADVFSGHPVSFALVTQGNQQFAAFFDTNRALTIAQRPLDGTTWKLVRLATTLGWDSHNYVTMAIDSGGFIHVSGNMHAAPLIYFRTTQALNIDTFQRVTAMTGTNEQSCTYPQFIHGPSGLVYAYRDGVSGNGNYVFNVYDVPTKVWRRLINSPLTDGQGLRNAYPVGPTLGPDGWWHLVYVWRETADAATNHDLSYAKSRDLVTWQSGTGRALTLPITLASSDIVDSVPVMGGMINNNTKVGFDSQNRPIVSYHKFDSAGNTQLYNARIDGTRWVTHQASNWNYRWNFGGGGTLIFQIQLEGPRVSTAGSLVQVWYHMQLGGWNAFRLDDATLAPLATIGRTLPYPASLERVESTTAQMGVRWAADTGAGPDPTLQYMLRWETLPENMDMARATIPPPTRLRLYGFRK